MRKILLACIAILNIFFTTNLKAQEWEEVGKQLSLRYDNNANQHYGKSVSVDGDYAVVGGYHYYNSPGNAYVLYFNGTSWETIAKLTPFYRHTYNFGCSVSISGDYIVIGANDSFGVGGNSGAAFIFEKPAGGWKDMTETAMLVASDASDKDYFGNSVCISGDNVVVGAYGDDDNGVQSGSVYVFTKPNHGWVDMEETAKLKSSDGASNDVFGRSVAISGNYIIVGASGTDGSGENSGSAYLFEKPVDGWKNITEIAEITSSDGAANDYFGYSVDISGDNVVVGAYGDDDNGDGSGSAYIYEKPFDGWVNNTENAKLTASDDGLNKAFGYSVSISESNVVVGAYGDDENGTRSGSAYIYEKPAGEWLNMTETAKFLASDGNQYDEFARSVSISGERVFVGASENDGGDYNSGCAYIYEKPLSGWSNTSETFKTYPTAFSNEFDDYGKVSIDGDYCVVGSPHALNATGCVYIYYYNGTNWVSSGILTAYNGREDDNFGHSVSISGDYIVVGAKFSDVNNNNNGSAYVFKKPAGGWKSMTETAELVVSNGGNNYWFGSSVDISGDHIVVGAYGNKSTYVFEKPVSGWVDMTETAILSASDGLVEDLFGYSVSVSEDNIVIGSYNNDNKGAAYVYTKPANGWTTTTETAKLEASDGASNDYFGYSVSISDDFIVIGAYGDDDNGNESGSAYLFEKPVDGWVNSIETIKLSASDGASNDYFGYSVGISGAHMVIGAYGDDDKGDMSGSIYLFEKLSSGWVKNIETFKHLVSDGSQDKKLGSYVDISDNYVITAAPWNNNISANRGSVYLFKCNKLHNINDVNICSGEDAVFTLITNNVLEQITYQWQLYSNDVWENIVNENNDTLIVPNISMEKNENKYRCLILGAEIDTSEIATLTIDPSFNISKSVLVCNEGSYTFPDGTTQNNITSQVIYTSNFQTVLGCDSIIETTVNINPPYNLSDTVSVCYGSSYTYHDGTTQDNITSQEVHISSFQGILGCDSIIETTVIVNPVYRLTEPKTIDSGSSYTFPNGTIQNNITSQTSHISNLKSIFGCDSIIETILYPTSLSPTTPFTRYCKYDNFLSAGYGNSVVESKDKELLIVGLTSQSGDDTNTGKMYIIKTDSLGNEMWSKAIAEKGVAYGLRGICTSDGNFAILGQTRANNDSPYSRVLIKLSNEGEIMWKKNYPDSLKGRCFYETFDKGFIIAGIGGSLFKTDSVGNIEWYRDCEESSYDIIQLKDSSYASANYWGRITGYDPLGGEKWEYSYYSGGYYSDAFNSIVETDDSCMIAVGESQKTGELNVVKLKLDGTLVWQKLFPYQAMYNFDYYAKQVTITKTSDGYFYIGFKSPRMKIIKIDVDGNEIPTQFDYGEGLNINHLIETQDKGIVCLSSLNGSMWRYFSMMKFDNQGNKCNNFITELSDTINSGELAIFNTNAKEVLSWRINQCEIPFSNSSDFSTNDLLNLDVISCETLGCESENEIKMNVINSTVYNPENYLDYITRIDNNDLLARIKYPRKSAFSKDNKFLYLTSSSSSYSSDQFDDAILTFKMDYLNDTMELVQVLQCHEDSTNYLSQVNNLVVSPNNKYVFTITYNNYACLLRDTITGQLSLNGGLFGIGSGSSYGFSPSDICISDDSKYVYMSDHGGDLIALLEVLDNGKLSVKEFYEYSNPGVDLLRYPQSLTLSNGGDDLYLADIHSIVHYKVDKTSGELTFISLTEPNSFTHCNTELSPDYIEISKDDKFMYVGYEYQDAISVFSINENTKELTLISEYFNYTNGIVGLNRIMDLKLSTNDNYLIATSTDDDGICLFKRDTLTGELEFKGHITEVDNGVKLGSGYAITINDKTNEVYLSADGLYKFKLLNPLDLNLNFDPVVCENENFIYSLTTTEVGLIYQWQENTGSSWIDISGETNDILTIPNVTIGMNGYKYRCIITGTSDDTTDVATLNVNPIYNQAETGSVCIGGSYIFPDGNTQNNITSQVIHVSNLHTVMGCDSIIETTVNVNPVYNLTETVILNAGESYVFPDNTVQDNITSQVIHISNLQTIFGCDSIIETTVNVDCNPVYNLSESDAVCIGESYIFPDGTIQYNITSQVVYISNLQTVLGCDSIVETTVNVNQIYNLSETVLIKSGGNYTFPDGTVQNNITSQVIYTSNLQTTQGCDSIIETTVNAEQIQDCIFTEEVEVCYGSDYLFPDGTLQSNITSQVVHESIIPSSIACDTIIETTVNVNYGDVTYYSETICEGETFRLGYAILSSPGLYGITLTNQFGCDSLVNLDLEVIELDVDLGRDKTIGINDTIILDAGENFEAYYWNTEEITQTILIDSTYGVGSHNFEVQVTDENDCTQTDNITITISDVTGISLNNDFEGDIKLYPNPTSGMINIDLTEINEPVAISIFDVTGRILLHKELNSNESNFDVEIPGDSGVYFIKLISGLKFKTYKVIKE